MTTNPADDLASKILEKENSDRQEIALLLDNYLGKDDRIFVQKTQMGNSEAYIGSVTLEWLDSRVRFASQMPLFRQKFDLQTNNIVRDDETIDEIIPIGSIHRFSHPRMVRLSRPFRLANAAFSPKIRPPNEQHCPRRRNH